VPGAFPENADYRIEQDLASLPLLIQPGGALISSQNYLFRLSCSINQSTGIFISLIFFKL